MTTNCMIKQDNMVNMTILWYNSFKNRICEGTEQLRKIKDKGGYNSAYNY